MDGHRFDLDAFRTSSPPPVSSASWGEPTLHPHIGELLAESRRLGFVTSIISNGARLERLLDSHAADLDWVGLSVDSADEALRPSFLYTRFHG